MIQVYPFEPKHMAELIEHDSTAWLGQYMGDDHAAALAKHISYTFDLNGKILGCAGAIEYWHNRCEVWAVLIEGLQQEFLPLHNAMKRQILALPYVRIEAKVDRNYLNAHRWVRTLGFQLEEPRLVKYFPDGRDASGYVKFHG